MVAGLRHADPGVQREVLAALQGLPVAADAKLFAAVLEVIEAGGGAEQRGAMHLIERLGLEGEAAARAASALVRVLDDDAAPQRVAALRALAALGLHAAPAAPRLARLLDAGEEPGDVLRALQAMGPGAAPAAEALGRLLLDRGEGVHAHARVVVAFTLQRIGPGAAAALPALRCAAEDDPEAAVRAQAESAIRAIERE